MKTSTRRLGTVAAVVATAVALCAGAAEASTVYQTGQIAHTCNFPSIGNQTSTVAARLVGPNSATSGSPVTLAAPDLSIAWTTSVQTLLRSAGYDLIRGTFNGSLGVTNGLPASNPFTASIAAQPIASLSYTATGNGTVTLTPGVPGTSALSLGATHSLAAELHKTTSGLWTPWTFNCTVKTSPVQNRDFSPSIPIT